MFLKDPARPSNCGYTVGDHIFLIYIYYVKNNKIVTLTPQVCFSEILKKTISCKEVFFDIQHFLIKQTLGSTGLVAQALDEQENPINIAAHNRLSFDAKDFYENYIWEVTELYNDRFAKRRFYTDLRYVMKHIEDNYDVLGELGDSIAESFPQSRKFAAVQN